MPTVTASTPMPHHPPISASQAAARFAAMGTTEVDDRPEDSRLLSSVHAGVRVVWRSVRCFGASEAAVVLATVRTIPMSGRRPSSRESNCIACSEQERGSHVPNPIPT